MKKKILLTLLTIVSCLTLALGITACKDSSTTNAADKWGHIYTIEAAYAEASDLGYSGTLEDFINSISGKDGANGKDGVGIANVKIISDNLIIILSDGTLFELGSIKGEAGQDGDSAYQIWLDNGHTGSEEDFLNWLKGDVGEAGQDGDDGLTPYIGANGNWWIGETDTGVLASAVNENPQGLEFYLLDDGTYSVGIGSALYLSNIEIPSTYKGKPVTSIIKKGFDCTNIKLNVKSIVIPDSVTEIGESAFNMCTLLENVAIGNGVTTIGNSAFNYCTSLRNIIIPDSVTEIGAKAFSYCTSLENVTIGNGVNTIGSYAFAGCTSLPSLTLPDNVTTIGIYTFYNCTSIESVAIGNGVNALGNCAFYGCTSLASIYIPDCVTQIGLSAFNNCTSLEIVTIGNGVTEISDGAFYGCASLASINIPDSVTEIGVGAFCECTSLTSVTFKNTTGWWYSDDSSATSGSISSSSLANASTAATYLKTTYVNYYWKRS